MPLSARRLLLVLAALAVGLNSLPAHAAADSSQLARVDGTVTYVQGGTTGTVAAGAKVPLGDRDTAITAAASKAQVILPDSSVVSMGELSNVQVGAFVRSAANGDGATITIPGGQRGTLRFDIVRPKGGKSNYTFVTPTSSIAVRGTTGLLSLDGAGNTTIACVSCSSGDVDVLVNSSGQHIALVTGQSLIISAAGIVTAGIITAAIIQIFAGAGVSTAAAGAPLAGGLGVSAGSSAAAGGAAAGGAAAGGAVGAVGVAGGAAAAVAAGAVAVAAGNSGTTSHASVPTASPGMQPTSQPTSAPTNAPTNAPTTTPTTTPTTAPSVTATPTPGPTSTGIGTIQVSHRKK